MNKGNDAMPKTMKLWNDNDSEKSWISRGPMVNSDWPVWFVLRAQYMEEFSEEFARDVGKYCVEILAVAPDAVSTEEMKNAFKYVGWEDGLANTTVEQKIDALVSYGTYARLHNGTGNNLSKLLKEARQQLSPMSGLFGFYMDRQQNAIGSTGWDFIKGEIGFKSAVA